MSSKKIPVSETQSPLGGNPFGDLHLEGLPSGEDIVSIPGQEAKKGRVVLRKEKSQRGGKTVIVVGDFAPHFHAKKLEDFARRAKQACGCGGTVAGREIELQGSDVARIRKFFQKEGFRVDGIS